MGQLKNLKFSSVKNASWIPHLGHEQVHALLLLPLARLEALDDVDEVLWSAGAVLLNLLQSRLKQTVGHLISEIWISKKNLKTILS